ncbi:(3R)-hydroxymyristoyl-[acyl carrier protein] dehydratase [Caenispirillum salinarum AK4]|uniref:3-hydroxyacyl-[acyl-carrier-protein] dehydratase FabZ n=1 Tax=Caenispirillum salinarum AK4 TaxID=1238182 RepID=K9GXS9_9PROT|nr:3-hydroxyacyl-ACP dehydratase FabZ [Caenispirillum salinarum]EKV30815.1 (3R)-hydroxymyristoyl-[acyl carrier protein] dehydratase [Caenispirillum salinarum AK4]
MDATSENKEGVTETATTIGIERIMEMIPHRYPFLLIDKVIDVKKNESCVGIKNVTMNEPFFQGHFPRRPVMPGVLIIECMAQSAAVLVVETLGPESEGKLVYFMSVEGARFRRPVVPGDRLELHVSKEHSRRNVWKFRAEGKVDGKVVAEATYAAMIMDD